MDNWHSQPGMGVLDARFVNVTGDSMTGALVIAADDTDNFIPLTITQNDITNNLAGVVLNNAGTGNTLRIVPTGNTPVQAATGGAVLLDNTSNTGIGLHIYSNQASAAGFGALLRIHADNSSFAQPAIHIVQDGTSGAAAHFRLDGPSPQIEFVETDQTSPAGKYEWQVQGDRMFFNGRSSADDAFETFMTMDRIGNANTGRITFERHIIVNEGGADVDTRMEGDNDANLIYLDAGNDRVGIGTSTPQAKLHVIGDVELGSGSETHQLLAYNSGRTNHGEIELYNLATGNMNFQTDFGGGSYVFNESGIDNDYRIESADDANNIFSDGGNNRVGIGTGTPNSKLQVGGSFSLPYNAETSTYTATDTDFLIDCTSGTFTVTLPTASGITGRLYVIKNSGTGVITVDGADAETIDGSATFVLGAQYDSVTVVSNGTNWVVI